MNASTLSPSISFLSICLSNKYIYLLKNIRPLYVYNKTFPNNLHSLSIETKALLVTHMAVQNFLSSTLLLLFLPTLFFSSQFVEVLPTFFHVPVASLRNACPQMSTGLLPSHISHLHSNVIFSVRSSLTKYPEL